MSACLAIIVAAGLIGEVERADLAADGAVDSIKTAEELAVRQDGWRKAWIAGIGGLPERKTPLNAKTGPVVRGEGYTFENVMFESQPGVYVTGRLFLPDAERFRPPYPCVMFPLGHSDAAILNPRYAASAVMAARRGLAVFTWDPISQGERRQSRPECDYTDNCSTEHSRLGFRGWLVGWNFARFCIWDAIRAVDYVGTRPEVDSSRIGVMGTSGGGTMSAYMQALDPRIKAAFPNCYISSLREVVGCRGTHDAEQFFFNQLGVGVNHAAILAMGQPRVSLAVGSRWKDYFPQRGAESTFAVFSNLVVRIGPPRPAWHFHCDGPHGHPAATREAMTDWMDFALADGNAPEAREHYWRSGVGDEPPPLPFRAEDSFFTASRAVRDEPGFRSLFDILADRAKELKAKRNAGEAARDFCEAVRRRAAIRPLADIRPDWPEFDVKFNWWYLKGAYGTREENHAATLALLGRSLVGEMAEKTIWKAAQESRANGGKKTVLRARGWDCIAAAHAFAAEPQLFSGVEFSDVPPNWTEMVTNPNPAHDSYAVAVWGALEEYDWTDLVPKGVLCR